MKNYNKLFLLSLTSMLVFSCAKEKEYEKVYKEAELESRSAFKTHKLVKGKDGKMVKEAIKYMYVPMTQGSPREVKGVRPFYQGQEKVVKLEWGKEGLNVIELDKDARFQDNELNNTPVLTIPGDYLDYTCKEDSIGDCTNAEIEDTEKTWESKKYFQPNYADLEVKELNELDLFAIDSECMSVEDTKLVDYEISSGVVNIELEKTFKVSDSWTCLRDNYFEGKLSFQSFKTTYFYSIVALDQLASKDYKAIDYPDADHSKFGFFKNERTVLADNFDHRRAETKYLLNRFNPNRKNNELVYYLDKNFNKKKNEIFLKATLDGVAIVNKGLAKANVPFKMVVKQQGENDNIKTGDLRYNTIVLIDDPLASGLLGYGPSVSNPYTGEIIQAHTNMYGGVLTSIVRSTYESAVDIMEEEKFTAEGKKIEMGVAAGLYQGQLPTALSTSTLATNGTKSVDVATSPAQLARVANSMNQTHTDRPGLNRNITEAQYAKIEEKRLHSKIDLRAEHEAFLSGDTSGMSELEIAEMELSKKEGKLKLNHMHQPEFFPIAGTVKTVFPELKAIDGILNEKGILKRWDILSKDQQAKVVRIIRYNAYLSTFVHELGHNFGLRHNFIGSMDKDNFYTDEEAKELGLHTTPAYSSVMDYSFSEFNQLQALGKYDVAALQFAYAREVETTEGGLVKVEGSLADLETQLAANNVTRKAYDFCTDENAGLSSTCNRFDEGTTLEEIAKFRALRYQQAYRYRNFRDGRNEFSTYGLPSYAMARFREFGQVRDMLEEYEFLQNLLSKELLDQCAPDATTWYCMRAADYKKALDIGSTMLIDIIKTPALQCAVTTKDDTQTVVGLYKLDDLYESTFKWTLGKLPRSCFDEGVEAFFAENDLVVAGENGKYFNGHRENDPRYNYSSDRTVRGVWADKVMAMRQLTKRRWNKRSTDRNHMALIDLPNVAPKYIQLVAHLTLGESLDSYVPFKTKDGAQFTIPYVIGNDYKIEGLEDILSRFKKTLGMNENGKSDLTEMLLWMGSRDKGHEFSDADRVAADNNRDLIGVTKYSGQITDRDSDMVYYYDSNERITYAASDKNIIASLMISRINSGDVVKVLEAIDDKIIQKVIKTRTDPDAPAELTTDEKLFFTLSDALGDVFVTAASAGRTFTEEQFTQFFGEKNGPVLLVMYNKGVPAMIKVLELKERIMTEAAETATEEEKKLFSIELQLLQDYTKGLLETEVLDYYKEQIKKLNNIY